MALIVQKYGGSSLASSERMQHVARKIVESARAGNDVVAVVSARGKTTDSLVELASVLGDDPPQRELDILLASGEQISRSLLAMAIDALGVDVVSLSGPQAGIRTDSRHFSAEIEDVQPGRVQAELRKGNVVIVAGFQGIGPHNELTTLGRGGSDTTAVALAAALDADRCEICSDVEGVWSADPRVVEDAVPLPALTYDEMTELSRYGAGVLNRRAVRYAARTGVEIVARSTFSDGASTRVLRDVAEPAPMAGVTCHPSVAWLSRVGEDAEIGPEDFEPVPADDLLVHRDDEHREVILPLSDLPERESYLEHLTERAGEFCRGVRESASVTMVGREESARRAAAEIAVGRMEASRIPIYRDLHGAHSHTWLVPEEEAHPAVRIVHEAAMAHHAEASA